MGGMATHWTLGCDAADPHRLAAFWALALGYIDEPGYEFEDGASLIDPEGVGPAIGFLRVPEGKTAKNRMHIDIRVAGEQPVEQSLRERWIRCKGDRSGCCWSDHGARGNLRWRTRPHRHARPRRKRVLRRVTTRPASFPKGA